MQARTGVLSISSAQAFTRASAPALVAAYMPQKARGLVATLVVKWMARPASEARNSGSSERISR